VHKYFFTIKLFQLSVTNKSQRMLTQQVAIFTDERERVRFNWFL